MFNPNIRFWPSYYKIIEKKTLKASSYDFESHNIIQWLFIINCMLCSNVYFMLYSEVVTLLVIVLFLSCHPNNETKEHINTIIKLLKANCTWL